MYINTSKLWGESLNSLWEDYKEMAELAAKYKYELAKPTTTKEEK